MDAQMHAFQWEPVVSPPDPRGWLLPSLSITAFQLLEPPTRFTFQANMSDWVLSPSLIPSGSTFPSDCNNLATSAS